MSVMASQIASASVVCSTVCSGADRRKHQSSVPLAFVRGIHRWPVDFPHKGPVTRKVFSFDDVIMWNPCDALPQGILIVWQSHTCTHYMFMELSKNGHYFKILTWGKRIRYDFDSGGVMQNCSNFTALVLALPLPCTKPFMYLSFKHISSKLIKLVIWAFNQ